jgi:DNA/RNA endonuclease YhcR with UshA esterase domain
MPKPSTLLATLVLAAWTLGAPASAETTIKPEDTASHAGQTVVVEGTVAKVSTSQRSATTFLNFCAPYPNQCFTAVIFQSARSLFTDPLAWEGKKVRVSGRVKLYKGKPEIVLEKPSQIESAPPP